MTDNIKLPKHSKHDFGYEFDPGIAPNVEAYAEAYAREAVRLNAAPVPDEHAAFEAWATKDGLSLKKLNGPTYYYAQTANAWHGWKARAALAAAPEPQGVPAPADDEAPTAEELEAFRRKHWQHWTASENLLIAHLVQTLRVAHPQQSGAEKPVATVISYKPLEHTAVIKWVPAMNGVEPKGFNVGASLYLHPQQSGADWTANLTRTARGWQERAEKAERSLERVTRWAIAAGVPPEKIQHSGAAQPEQERKPLSEDEVGRLYRNAQMNDACIMLRSDYERGIRDAERHHGITKESP